MIGVFVVSIMVFICLCVCILILPLSFPLLDAGVTRGYLGTRSP